MKPTLCRKAEDSRSTSSLPEDLAALAGAQGTVDWGLVSIPHTVESRRKVRDVEWRQESKGTHGEADHGGEGFVSHKEGGKVKHGAITPQRYAKVHACRAQLPGFWC